MFKPMNSVTLSSSNEVYPASSPEEGLYLHIPDVSGLDTLPERGTISFKYKRKELALGEDKLSARLCLLEIVNVEKDEDCPTEQKTDDVVDKLFEEAQKNEDEEDSEDE